MPCVSSGPVNPLRRVVQIPSTVSLSAVRSESFVVFGDACPGSAARAEGAPFDKYAVIPVTRKVWQHVKGGSPAAAARHLIIARTTRRCNARPVSRCR